MKILKTLAERCDPGVAALLVADMQNDFCSLKGASALRGEELSAVHAMLPCLHDFIQEARQVGLPIIFVKTTHSEWTDAPSWVARASQENALATCREGSWGAEFYQGIVPLPEERIVIKHRYSAFIHTDLNTVLKAHGVESLLMTGVATNVCVETTARDAYMFDYYVTVIEDCVAAYDPILHENTLENIRRHFGVVASSREVIKTWQRVRRRAAAP